MTGRQGKADTPAKPQPHRFRVSVPAADEAVVAWMELQDNPSLSVRMLIRESIERQGFVDVVNRPVSQLPRQARTAEPSEAARVAEAARASEAARAVEAAHAVEVPGGETRLQPSVSVAEPEFWPEAPTPADRPNAALGASAPAASEPERASGELQDVNDIFSRMR